MSKLREIFHVCYCGRGSTLLLWRYDWSCTSGFVDDAVVFAANWLGKGDASRAEAQRDLRGGSTDLTSRLIACFKYLPWAALDQGRF